MPLLAERKLDHALGREVGKSEEPLLVGDRVVVHLEPTALDLATRLAR